MTTSQMASQRCCQTQIMQKCVAWLMQNALGWQFLDIDVRARRSPAVKDDDDYEPPGQPEVLADVDYAEVCASVDGDGVDVPSWYQHEYGAELMHSQVLPGISYVSIVSISVQTVCFYCRLSAFCKQGTPVAALSRFKAFCILKVSMRAWRSF